MYTKFVIISEGRTGSNFLMYLLRSHPGIVMYSELFNRNDPKVLEFLKQERRLITNTEDPGIYLKKEVFCDGYPKGVKAVGFKLMYYQAQTKNWVSLWDYLRDQKDIKIVHIIRKNLLDRYLSLQLARRDNTYITFSKDKGIYKDPIFIDQKDFEDKVKISLRDRKKMRLRFEDSKIIEIAYEDLCDRKDITAMNLLEFLDLPYKDLKSATVKQRQFSQKEMICNFDELKGIYEGTSYAEYFQD